MRIRIENVTLVTTDEANRVFENGCLVWEDDTILALNDFSMHVDEVIDGQGGLLLPGMVNTHCHLGMIPFRSLGDDCPDRLRRFRRIPAACLRCCSSRFRRTAPDSDT